MVIAASRRHSKKPSNKYYNRVEQVLDVPNLIQIQLESFEWLKEDGLKDLFEEISPIEDFSGGRFELTFGEHEFQEPKLTERECRLKETTYSASLYVVVQLLIKSSGERKQQKLFMGDIPMMTRNGTFIINGAERVVVSQLVRSPGAYFTADKDSATGRTLCSAKLIPYRGAWVELETSNRDILYVKVDRKRRTPVSTLLRALGYTSDEEILKMFRDVDTDPDHQYMATTISRDSAITTEDEALVEFYRRLRPGEPPSVENARALLHNLFFNPRKYDLNRVGRYKLNRSLNLDVDERTLSKADFVELLRKMIRINNGRDKVDDIDHLGNRRVRAVGELIQNQLRVGLLRMERVVKERMTTQMDPDTTTPAALINIRPVVAAVREFFGGSQLSQFMDQTNPLAELTHKRRLSALGPGGLSRDRAGFDVRDVHNSHYGRICPIETPEGPNIGLLGSLATYARINQYGFIETPYRPVLREISSHDSALIGHHTVNEIKDNRGNVLIHAGKSISKVVAERMADWKERTLNVKPYVSMNAAEIVYMPADEEERHVIGQANTKLDSRNQIASDRIEVRFGDTFAHETADKVEYLDVSPMQIVSVSTALIPFLEHDDANRALMGSNMQRQAVPLVRPEAPTVGTGMEERVARDSRQVITAEHSGIVAQATGDMIVILTDDGEKVEYPLTKFRRSNQGTCVSQRAIVEKGQRIVIGDALADSSSTEGGELALGQNILVGFMSWEGYNYEDAIILSENLVKADKYTSIHIEKHESEARDTKLGPEEITRDIPNVGEESLRDLDEEGIIRIGAYVAPGDILVGKITPKGETELTAEEKLLRAIFGEKARDVKDTSLRVPHGEYGKVIDVKILTKDAGDNLPAGVIRMVRVWVAQTRKIREGDKMAGRHGNKGVIAKILPAEDMPYLADGTPLDVILNPIGVPSRMNLGQVLEMHLGYAASILGFRARTPVFDGATHTMIEDALSRAWFVQASNAVDQRDLDGAAIDDEIVIAWLAERGYKHKDLFDENKVALARDACIKIWLAEVAGVDISGMKSADMYEMCLSLDRKQHIVAPFIGKQTLYDGRTGEPFDQPIGVGTTYMLKLIHLVEDKIHARSTGPYSLITQQPLGGKAQFGGQRFGEMEVWALEAYSAAYNLQEMLTVKSDDVIGRVKTYEASVKGENVIQPGVPESFHVLLKELQGLGLSVELLNEVGNRFEIDEAEAAGTGVATGDDGIDSSIWAEMALGEGMPDLDLGDDLDDEDLVESDDGVPDEHEDKDDDGGEDEGLVKLESEDTPTGEEDATEEDGSEDDD